MFYTLSQNHIPFDPVSLLLHVSIHDAGKHFLPMYMQKLHETSRINYT